MSYARVPQLGISLSFNASASTSSGVQASASSSASSTAKPAAPLVFGMDAATLAFAEKKCGPAPKSMTSSDFPSWAACAMGGTGGAVPAPPKPVTAAPGAACYVASKNASLADVRKGCAVLKRGQLSGDSNKPILFWRQFLGLPAGIVFDVQLEDATKAFQRHMRLPETGQLNRETLAFALAQPLKEGADHDDVWALHRLLGYVPAGSRYKYTKETTQRLLAYQAAMALPVSGVVDDATRSALLAQGMTASLAAAAAKPSAAKPPAAEEKPTASTSSASSGSSGSKSTGMLIMVGLVGLAAYFVWASPKVKRKSA